MFNRNFVVGFPFKFNSPWSPFFNNTTIQRRPNCVVALISSLQMSTSPPLKAISRRKAWHLNRKGSQMSCVSEVSCKKKTPLLLFDTFDTYVQTHTHTDNNTHTDNTTTHTHTTGKPEWLISRFPSAGEINNLCKSRRPVCLPSASVPGIPSRRSVWACDCVIMEDSGEVIATAISVAWPVVPPPNWSVD